MADYNTEQVSTKAMTECNTGQGFTKAMAECNTGQVSTMAMVDCNTGQIPMKAIVDLRGYEFIIPSQQRGYKWTKENISELFQDFLGFIDKGEAKKVYCLQPLAVVPKGANRYIVLDGQQRLTTLFLLFKAIFKEELYSFTYERDESSPDEESPDDKVANRWNLLHNITDKIDDTSIDTYFITNAYKAITDIYKKLSDEQKTELGELLRTGKGSKSVQVIWYEVEENKSHTTFRNLNSGKIPLSNTELVKALFLNRTSGLKEGLREQAATLFEEMEQMMRNDSFWYMFNPEEQKEGQSRLDFIFNLAAECSPENYSINPRWSFRNYFDKDIGKTLEEKWQTVRHTYLRLKDMYEDPYIYHYVGFLTFCKDKSSRAEALLSWSREKSKTEFRRELAVQIGAILKQHGSLGEYNYGSGPKALRRLFLIYNIETILFRYEEVNGSSELALKNIFERFPFELLHKQTWDIEHIASRTDNDFRSSKDREDWLKSVKADLGRGYDDIGCAELESHYKASLKKGDFDLLYRKIMTCYEEKLGCETIPDSVPEDAANEGRSRKDKDQIGNLTLLDSHTNRSFHNALFPRKRRIVLVAGGLQSKDKEDERIKRVFIPICTRQCFTKSYRRTSDVNLNAWTQSDADAYYCDIELKLKKYFA